MKSLPMPRYSRKENPECWLETFQATAKVQGWTSDEDKLMVIPMFFKSEVRNWFYDGGYTEFKDFSEAFVERFGLKMKKYVPLKKLLNIKKRNKESVQAYADRFRHWKVRHDMQVNKDPSGACLSERDMLQRFVNGLNPKPLRQAVRAKNPKNLNTAIRMAIEWKEDEDDSFSDSDEGPAYGDQDSENSGSDVEEKPAKAHKNRKKATQLRDEAVESLTKKIEEMKIILMKQVPSNRECFNCQAPGHEAAQCQKPCKLCNGQEGAKDHAFFECPRY
ncbi:hypothetical protein K450DRAFT_264124 [Umbelopsis ramanniana AG]|uniref:CCHC-type domain-containing protein n=1 Tax=Umbelopsis ramanniana AG TaxID=1314678 RepID=A0AAD5E1R3_UMBRA|nr:uncharacterized protein K450DRAFT_264124 [Umbelopsis ramanniana AG]KAI8574916.1 hypothetical protein K450DRAFT_264124 [Umbelopsis ramanniana AG]